MAKILRKHRLCSQK